MSTLKHLNLDQNQIQFFSFEFYVPLDNNFYTSNPTCRLDYLNVRSNRLTTLDVSSIVWLNKTTTVTDLTANPWNCDSSVLLEVWRGLKHKLTLHCASPRQLQGKSWDVMEEFCCEVTVDMNCISNTSSEFTEDMNYKSDTSSETVRSRTVYKEEKEVGAKAGGLSVITTSLIVTGVLLVCAFGGGIILETVKKRRRKKSKMPE